MNEDKEMLGKHANNLGRFGAARGGTAHAQCSPLAMRHCGGKLQSEACALSFERSASAIPFYQVPDTAVISHEPGAC